MTDTKKPLAKKSDIIIQELTDELLIYNLSTDRAFCLNETSAFIWNKSNGKNTVSEIKSLMEKEFNSPVNEDLIWLALDQLGEDDLLEVKPENKFTGISRREVVRRIGLSSLIALPVIASLKSTVNAAVCPSASTITQAQCADNNPACEGRPCTGGTTCTMGNCV